MKLYSSFSVFKFFYFKKEHSNLFNIQSVNKLVRINKQIRTVLEKCSITKTASAFPLNLFFSFFRDRAQATGFKYIVGFTFGLHVLHLRLDLSMITFYIISHVI